MAALKAAVMGLPNQVETISFVEAREGCSSDEEMGRVLKDRQTSAPCCIQLCLGRGVEGNDSRDSYLGHTSKVTIAFASHIRNQRGYPEAWLTACPHLEIGEPPSRKDIERFHTDPQVSNRSAQS